MSQDQENTRPVSDSFHWLDEFLSYFSGVRERSATTMREYHYDLRLFFRWYKRTKGLCPAHTDLADIDLEDIDENLLREVTLGDIYRFISWLSLERNNGPAARARRVSSLRAFFNFLSNKVHVIDTNPTAELEAPKQMKSLPRFLDLEESTALLRSAADEDTRLGTRDYCILTLFLNCGMRLSELIGIDVDDIRGERLSVIGKGHKERTVYLNELCIEALTEWLEERVPGKKPDESALFISRNGRRISQRAVENVVKKYLLKAGLDPKRYSAHKLRHTAATLMYQYGQVDLRSLQQILGHESVATTEIYTHINDKMLQKAVAQNPLNQLRKQDISQETEKSKESAPSD